MKNEKRPLWDGLLRETRIFRNILWNLDVRESVLSTCDVDIECLEWNNNRKCL